MNLEKTPKILSKTIYSKTLKRTTKLFTLSFCNGTIVTCNDDEVQLEIERKTENSSLIEKSTSWENLTSGRNWKGGY